MKRYSARATGDTVAPSGLAARGPAGERAHDAIHRHDVHGLRSSTGSPSCATAAPSCVSACGLAGKRGRNALQRLHVHDLRPDSGSPLQTSISK